MADTTTKLADETFDYVIIGGGTAGLALATLLAKSSDPVVTVVVLEAGGAHEDDAKILTSTHERQDNYLNPEYDWGFMTVPQPLSNNRQIYWARGKGLGGTSGINFQFWGVPPAQDIDAFEKLGNPGWNWNEYEKFIRRIETHHLPSGGNDPDRNSGGPIHTVIPFRSESYDNLAFNTLGNMGLPKIDNPYKGDISGYWLMRANVGDEFKRSYSANTYFDAKKMPSNLTVVPNALVTRILFSGESEEADLTATGVEFNQDGKKHIVMVNKEVIVSAGTVKTPQILELSGIGRREVLAKIGVDIKLELPGVGENVQEHISVPSLWELDQSAQHEERFLESLKIHAGAPVIPNTAATAFAYFPLAFTLPDSAGKIIKDTEDKIQELRKGGKLPPGLAEQYEIQFAALRNPAIPDCQLIFGRGRAIDDLAGTPEGKTYLRIVCMANHTFSRGTVHATSNDPTANPEIDAHFFEMEHDMDILTHQLRVIREMVKVEPMKKDVIAELQPGPNFNDENLSEYVRSASASGWHTIGSCSMLPRDKQGVVSPELVVYGTKNVRIADLSVIPLHFAAHSQTTAYVIAEKAADMILGKK